MDWNWNRSDSPARPSSPPAAAPASSGLIASAARATPARPSGVRSSAGAGWAGICGLLAALSLVAFGGTAALAGGYTHPDNGAEALGRAGARATSVNDASALYYNPANLTYIDGLNIFLGGNFTVLDVEFQRAGLDQRLVPDEDGELPSPEFGERRNEPFDSVSRECERAALCSPVGFVAPMAFIAYGGDDWGVGIGGFGPPGVGTSEFPEDGPQRYTMVRQELSLLWLAAGGAYRVGPVSFGATFMMGRVDVLYRTILDANPSVADADRFSKDYRGESSERYSQAFDLPVQVGVDGWAPAGIVGVTWEILDQLAVSLTVQTTAVFEAEGNLSIDFDKSEIPESLATLSDDSASVTITQPWIVRVGGLWKYILDGRTFLDVELNFVYESWSLNDELRLNLPGGFQNGDEVTPIGALALNKQWEDTFSLRLGSDVNPLDWLTARFGLFVESGAVPEETTALDVYSYNRLGVGLGATFRTPIDLDIAVGYLHIFQAQREVDDSEVRSTIPLSRCNEPFDNADACPVPGEPPGEAVGNGTYDTSFDIWSIVLRYNYDFTPDS